jgi:plastocyanin
VKTRILAAALVLGSTLALGAANAGAAQQRTIDINGFTFAPNVATVDVGDTIVWRNVAPNVPHNAFRNAPFAIATEDVDQGASTTPIVATTPGTFTYICSIHGAGMAGTIVVNDLPAVVPESPWVVGLGLTGAGMLALVVARRRRAATLAA